MLFLLATSLSAIEVHGQSLVTYFNFNDSNLTSDAGSQNSTLDVSQFSSFSFSAGSTVGGISGETAGQALSLANGNEGENNDKSIRFNLNTLGLQDLSLSYATTRTPSGFTTQVLSYSTDGIFFTIFVAVNPAGFELHSFDLSAVSAIENQPYVAFQLTFSGGSPDSAFATSRIDNLQLSAIPEPGSPMLIGLVIAGCIAFHKFRRESGPRSRRPTHKQKVLSHVS